MELGPASWWGRAPFCVVLEDLLMTDGHVTLQLYVETG